MSQFMGTFENRLDAKGRVSIPAQFRAELRADGETDGPITVVLRPSHKYDCVEGWPTKAFRALADGLNRLPQFSDEHDNMSTLLYSDAYPVESDKEGRILLGDKLIRIAKLSGQVAFMGRGETFEIWDPSAMEQRKLEAIAATRHYRAGLPSGSPA